MKYLSKYKEVFFNKKIKVNYSDILKLVNFKVLSNIEDYFLDFEYTDEIIYKNEDGEDTSLGKIGFDVYYESPNFDIDNSFHIEDLPHKPKVIEVNKDYIITYHVFIQLNNRYEYLPLSILNKLNQCISRIEKSEELKFSGVYIKSFNWEKYKKAWLYFKELSGFDEYIGDVVSFRLIFTDK